jgi:hypothetical protein
MLRAVLHVIGWLKMNERLRDLSPNGMFLDFFRLLPGNDHNHLADYNAMMLVYRQENMYQKKD